MAIQGLSRWCAGILVAGTFWLGNRPCSAAEVPAAGGKVSPAPAVRVPTDAHLQPIPDSSQSGPAEIPNSMHPDQGAVPPSADDDCLSFCGTPLCSPPGRFWARADALMWWTNGTKLPPLVTTSPQDTPVSQAGVLPAATILYGDQTIADDARGGVRTTLGMWLDRCHIWDLEFDFFILGQRDNSYDSGLSTGNPILTRPFFNVQTNADASELVAYPGIASGSVSVGASSSFYSTGAMLSYNLCSCDSCASCDSCNDGCGETGSAAPLLYCCRTDLLVGLRYYNFSDSLTVHENPTLLAQTPTRSTLAAYDIHDNFTAKNEFYGSEIGLRTEIYRGRWSLGILTKVALGNTHETVTINGQTVITPTGQAPMTYNTGILASGSNSGTYQRDEFTVIPQLGLELGFQVNCHWRAYLGYDLLYWACVQKAADQIDLDLDPRNFPPPTTGGLSFPVYPHQQSSFWAQGIHLGGEFRF
jgi:hypothetical protein